MRSSIHRCLELMIIPYVVRSYHAPVLRFEVGKPVIEKHGVEKLRTPGDGDDVMSDLPHTCSDHTQALVSAALEMMNFSVSRRPSVQQGAPQCNRVPLSATGCPLVQQAELRIGINSGSAFAGVIGSSKFQFDIWEIQSTLFLEWNHMGSPLEFKYLR